MTKRESGNPPIVRLAGRKVRVNQNRQSARHLDEFKSGPHPPLAIKKKRIFFGRLEGMKNHRVRAPTRNVTALEPGPRLLDSELSGRCYFGTRFAVALLVMELLGVSTIETVYKPSVLNVRFIADRATKSVTLNEIVTG
jgi:hypothetical protein